MAYMVAEEYVEAFTEAEAIRLTDTTKSGRPDDDRITEALNNAEAFANAFLTARYSLPIADPPDLLRKIVADLAREELHKTRPTEAVTINADRARSLLKDLSAGRASIPAPADGVAPTTNPVTPPAVSHDRRARVFTDDAMSDFVGLGMSYGGTAFSGPRGY